MKQIILKFILMCFGALYLKIEKQIDYPDDSNILGMKIDEELQNMNRKQLCEYMSSISNHKGFYQLQSTTKIRYGCQLLRNWIKTGDIRVNETE